MSPRAVGNIFGRYVGAVRERPVASAATAAMIALMVGVLIVPILLAVRAAFSVRGELGVYWFTRLLTDGSPQLLANGLMLAATTTLICMIISLPLAVIRTRCDFIGRGVLGVAVLMPLILPPFVGALAMRKLLGEYGSLNVLLDQLGIMALADAPDWLAGGFVAVAGLQALHLFPILYLNASAALANIDPAHIQAARNLGAGPLRTFFSVTLPLMRPGLFAGGTIVFIWAFTDIGTPLVLNYRALAPVRIFDELTGAYTGKTFALVFVLLVASVLLYVLGKFVFGRAGDTSGSKATVQSETRRLGPLGTLGAWAAFAFVLVLALTPHVGVILTATSASWFSTVLPESYTAEHLVQVVRDPDTYRSILNSLQYAGCSTVLDVLLGMGAAWLIVRSRPPGASLLDSLVMLPLAVPGLIMAAGYVALTVPGSTFERFGPQLNPFLLLVVAYAVRRIPFVVRGVSAGLQQVPESLEEAARNLGSSRAGAAVRITFPLIAANIIAAAVLAFSMAMLEVSDSLVLAQRGSDYPITKQIYALYTGSTADSINMAAALGVYGMALLGGTMAAASLLLGRKLGTIFRA